MIVQYVNIVDLDIKKYLKFVNNYVEENFKFFGQMIKDIKINLK